MLVDADLGLANVDVLLGLHTRFHLGHVVNGQCALEDAIVTGPHGLQIVPAASGVKHMASLSRGRARRASSGRSATCTTASRSWSSIRRRVSPTA